MKNADLITVVIPVYNRPYLLSRILDYYSKQKLACKVIVADSGSHESKQIHRETISSFHDLNISYFDDYSEINLFPKVVSMLHNVDTKYSVICADDDFITVNGIEQSVDFLEKNLDYTAVHGYEAAFQFTDDTNGNRVLQPKYCHYEINLSIASPAPQSRLHFNFTAYYPTFYAVHRTDFQKMILEESVKYTTEHRFEELLASMITAIYGKIKVLDLLYTVRKIHLPSKGEVHTFPPGLNTFIEDGTFDEKYTKFKERLVKHLMITTDLTATQAGQVVDNAFWVYYEIGYQKNKELKLMYEKIHQHMPEYQSKNVFGRRLLDPSSKDYKDYNNICCHMLRHFKNARELTGSVVY